MTKKKGVYVRRRSLKEKVEVKEDKVEKQKKTPNEMLEEINKVSWQLRTYCEKNRRFLCDQGRMLGMVHDIMKGFTKLMADVKKTNEQASETLCNVLLAIRQNEYLQAWHPKKGMPASLRRSIEA